MIRSIYVISRNGIPLYVYNLDTEEDHVTESTLFSGVISAIQTVLAEIAAGQPKSFTTSTNEVFLEAADDFALAIVTDARGEKFEEEIIKSLMSEIITQIGFTFSSIPDHNLLTEEENKQLEDIVMKSLKKANHRHHESIAAKKMKDALW